MSQELFDQSVEQITLGQIISFNSMFVPSGEAIEKKGKEMMKVFGNRARLAILLGGSGILILNTLIIQLGLLYFTIKAVNRTMEDARITVSREILPEVRLRDSIIKNYITPFIKQSVDSILYNSESDSKVFSDDEVRSAIELLEDFFVSNGWKEYFEVAKVEYPYMNAWMK